MTIKRKEEKLLELLLRGRSFKIDFGGGGVKIRYSAQKSFDLHTNMHLVYNSQISSKYKGCDSFPQLYSIKCVIIDFIITRYSFQN